MHPPPRSRQAVAEIDVFFFASFVPTLQDLKWAINSSCMMLGHGSEPLLLQFLATWWNQNFRRPFPFVYGGVQSERSGSGCRVRASKSLGLSSLSRASTSPNLLLLHGSAREYLRLLIPVALGNWTCSNNFL